MGKLFDESFCTSDYDQEMVDFLAKVYNCSNTGLRLDHGFLKYSLIYNEFWTSNYFVQCPVLTKQQFKEKIGMIDKEGKKDEMVSYKLIDKDGYLKSHAKNGEILHEVGSLTFQGEMSEDSELVNDYITVRAPICPDEFQFFEKVDNNTQAESITEPVAEIGDELKMLPYQNLIDDCKELSISLVVTDEGLHILDCINSVEYKIEVPDDYQKIVDALRLLQNKEMD